MKKLLLLLIFSLVSIALQADNIDEAELEILNKPREEQAGIVDINRKLKETKQLVRNAVIYLDKNTIETACDDFIHKPIWRKGELFVFVFKVINKPGNKKGAICLAHGDDTSTIWQDISEVKGTGGKPLIEEMLAQKASGARMGFLWDGGFMSAYIRRITAKDNSTYILGSGFFPESDEFTTKQLVKTAVAHFNTNGRNATFALINNPNGPFVKGDIYTFAYDFNGRCVAHGQNAALVGQNLIDQVDSRGKPLMKELISVAKNKGRGWVEYYWRNAFKRSYVERVVDPKTKRPYLISAGYYPNITLKTVKSYVNRAIKHLKASGSKVAFADFSNQVGEFANGGLSIFVYDLNGKSLANGDNPGFVGQDLSKRTDPDGRYIVQDMIKVARKYGKGLVQFVEKNSNTIAYVERVDVPDGKFIIGSEYHPSSKPQAVQTMVSRAVEHLREKMKERAFRDFSSKDGDFYRGDLHIFVYGSNGTRFVNGIQTSQIWRNFMKTTDQEGKQVVGDIISTAINGGGWVEYKARNATRRVYVKSVEKTDAAGEIELFAVGCGYFL